MLQMRSGRCPNCKEDVLPGAEICPNCHFKLDWEKMSAANARQPGAAARSTPGASATSNSSSDLMHTIVHWLAYFLVGCLLVFLAMTVRNKFFNSDQNSDLDSAHATSIQDSETFREQIAANRANAEAPEAAYVLGSAMPLGSDVLQITVKSDWERLDYKTRLDYAQKLTERWKSIHAPHRSYFILLDEAGNEIGGRGLTGKTWVDEKQQKAPKKRKSEVKSQKSE